MNQSKFLAIICNLLKTREKSRVQGATGFGIASRWLKKWRETFKPINKRSNRNRSRYHGCITIIYYYYYQY